MPTIITYTDARPSANEYPARLVSPTHASRCCCARPMEPVGPEHAEGRWLVQYKRCAECGFAVRVIVRELPEEAIVAELRKTLATAFARNGRI